ncbi:MAG: hypothetical protein HS105_01960 [Chloracidobacterium sp.]|nr:hypothetical protein [Chloracidobacterium sp.]MCO5334468.1 hypothetical protein [Pyrinomonadaceae bacterium]
MKKILVLLSMVLAAALLTAAQPRPLPADAKAVKPAPESFAAKYEGGLFGYSDKTDGTLRFDDANEQLVFRSDNGQQFSVPYASLLTVYPQSQSVRTTAGSVISAIPLPGAGFAGFIREKRRYLILDINDNETRMRSALSFKLGSKDLLDSVIATLGAKAGLKQRGDAFYRAGGPN